MNKSEQREMDAGYAEAEAEYNVLKHEYSQCSYTCGLCKAQGIERWRNDWYLDKNGKRYE